MNAQAKDIPSTAIAEYSPTAAALADIASRMAKVVYDVSTPKGLAAAKKDRAEVRDLRVALEKKRVEIKAPALKRCNEIDTEARRITAELLKYETPPDDAIKAEERRVEAERQAVIAREEARVKDITGRIDAMRAAVNLAVRARLSVDVARFLSDVQSVVVDEDLFAEFKDTAALVQRESLAELERIRDEMVARETEAERLRKDREEFDRKRAEQEAADRTRREREEDIRERLAELRGCQTLTASSGVDLIAEHICDLTALTTDSAIFGEFTQQAVDAKASGIARLNALHTAAIEHQMEQVRLEVQRAAQRREDDRIAGERRELEARQQAERDAQAERDREAREAEERRLAAELDQRRKDDAAAEAQRIANYRPTFDEIVAFVAAKFGKTPEIVRTWIREAPVSKKAAA